MKNGLIVIISLMGLLLSTVLVGLFMSEWLWPELWGSHSLGAGLDMVDGDCPEDRAVIYSSNLHGKTCYGGTYIIPTYEEKYDSLGNFIEYVIDAKSDENHIYVITFMKTDNKRKYYIIDKSYEVTTLYYPEYIRKRYTTLMDDSVKFKKLWKQLK